MEKIYIQDIEPGEQITSFFLVQYKEVAKKRNNEDYLKLQLFDRTGSIKAVMWDNVEEVKDTFERDDIIKIQGVSGLYQDTLQIVIRRLRRAEEDEIDLGDLLPAGGIDREELITRLREEIAEIGSPFLRQLLENTFNDDAILAGFSTAPAGQSLHHVYIGGLIYHTLSVLTIAKFLADHYGNLDKDLIIAGGLLHDLGKIRELRYDRSFGYTDEGRLVGHIPITLEMVGEKIRAIEDFPHSLKIQLEHLIISHHGKLDWGSPKPPMTLEALILHHADDMDAKYGIFQQWMEQQPDPSNPEWTRYSKQLERYIYKGNQQPEDDEDPPQSLNATENKT
jgi:3'-5' exoribonuclease